MTGKKNKRSGPKKSASPPGKSVVVGLTTSPNIFPPLFRGKLFYDTVVALGPAAGALATNVFRGNSVYDPDLTGVGASARGYSQLSALYGRYRVLSFSGTITFVNLSTTTPLTCFVVVNPVTTVGTDITQVLQQRRVWTRSIATTAGAGTATHSVGAPVHAVYGVPAVQVRNEDDFASVTGNNPNNGVYMHVGAYANGASAGSFNIHVRMEFDTVWSLPLEL